MLQNRYQSMTGTSFWP